MAGVLSVRESLLVRAVLRWPSGDGPGVSSGPGGGPGVSSGPGGGTGGSDETEGWGECAALPWPTYTAEFTDGALAVAERFLVPHLLAQRVADGRSVGATLAWAQGHNMAKAALEMALLDAELRATGQSFASLLRSASATDGPSASTVPAGVSIGLGPLGAVLEEVEGFVAQGYRRAKFKVQPGQETDLVAVVRRHWPELVIVVDANGAYAPLGPLRAAEALAGLGPYSVACVEQPLAADDLAGHAELAKRCPVPICLDESLTSLRAVELALALGSCSVVSIKAGRMGGYLEAVRAHDACEGAGVPVWCGGMVETGLGRAANVALAALPNFSLPGDLSASSRFFLEDVAGPVELGPDGTIAVPGGPGLGVEVGAAALAKFATYRSWHPVDGGRS